MRDRVVFARLDSTADAYGNVTSGAYANLFSGASYPCELVLERMDEKMQAGRLAAPTAGKLKIRKDSQTETLTEADRATINGTAYQIRGIDATDLAWVWMAVERGVAS